MVRNPPANAGDMRVVGSIPVLGDPLGEEKAAHSIFLPNHRTARLQFTPQPALCRGGPPRRCSPSKINRVLEINLH